MSLLLALTLASILVQSSAAPQTGEVSGRVLDDGTQMPIADAQVTLIVSGPPPRPWAIPPHRPPIAVTDRDGRYVFSGLAPGRYGLIVHKPGFAVQEEFRPREVHIAAAQRLSDVNLTLQRGAVIAGRVLDEGGEPFVNAQVIAMRKAPAVPPAAAVGRALPRDVLLPIGSGAQTNDLGEFRLFGLPAGEFYIQAMRPDFGHAPAPSSTTVLPTYFPGTSDRAAAQPITVGAGQMSAEIIIRMVSAPAFQVSGVVRDGSGRPVANAMVRLTLEEPAAQFTFMMGPGSQSRTDASGRFAINNMTDGAYTLVAVAPVVISGSHERRPGDIGSGAVTSFGFSSGGANGSPSGPVFTETKDGTTIQYHDNNAARVPITVNHAHVSGLEIVIRTAAR
jgi:hypothetical protein